MPFRLTPRLSALLAIAAASAAAACADSSLAPSPTVEQHSASAADTGHGSTPTPTPPPTDSARPDSTHGAPPPSRPDSAHPAPPDTLRPGAAALWGLTIENFAFQWRDAAGVAHDSVGYRGVAGATVTIFAATRADSTNPAPPADERQVATVTSDASGQFRTGSLPDGWYVLRATHTANGTTRTASATTRLVNGFQFPMTYLNLR